MVLYCSLASFWTGANAAARVWYFTVVTANCGVAFEAVVGSFISMRTRARAFVVTIVFYHSGGSRTSVNGEERRAQAVVAV